MVVFLLTEASDPSYCVSMMNTTVVKCIGQKLKVVTGFRICMCEVKTVVHSRKGRLVVLRRLSDEGMAIGTHFAELKWTMRRTGDTTLILETKLAERLA